MTAPRPIGASANTIQFTRLTNSSGLLTKEYSLDLAGNLKKGTKAFLIDGTATRVTVSSLEDFSVALSDLNPNECFAYGVTEHEVVGIVTKSRLIDHPGKIARDRKHFQYRKAPAILMLDYDPDLDGGALEPEALREAMLKASPALADAPMLWTASSSSNIVNKTTGEDLTGRRGQRLYISVQDGSDIPRAGKSLYEHLWRIGRGRFVVAKNGRLLDRNLIDAGVWQPEREDFAAGAACVAPLVQHRPEHIFWARHAPPFDSARIVDLTGEEIEIVTGQRREARVTVEAERLENRTAYIKDKAATLTQEAGIAMEDARRIIAEALDKNMLFADYILYPQEGGTVTVGEILDSPELWHGKRFADPVEPDYRNDMRIAYANLRSGGSPYLFSHAHGGQRFQLFRQPGLLQLIAGETPRIADECLNLIRQHGHLYDFGYRQLVRIAENRIHVVNATWIADYIGRIVRFERFDLRAKDWRPADTPERLAKMICERAGERALPKLRAIVTAPTLRMDGTVLDRPGYDEQSGLLYLSDEIEPCGVPLNPDKVQVLGALNALWHPFTAFPFADDVSRGAMLSALLSTVIRRSLPTCPGHIFDAPTMGSGKTLLARCIAVLGGHPPELSVPASEDEEARKSLFASLLEGAGCIIWDNVIQPIDGAAINNFLTAALFKDRILGLSETDALPNSAMFLATGNNVRVVGDAARRFVICRIDAKVEQPYLREFTFDPMQWLVAHRMDMVIAALTLIRGYIAAGRPRMAKGNTASFEDWDRLVRQTVCWVGTLDCSFGFADPMLTVEKNAALDPNKGVLHTILEAWHAHLGDSSRTSTEVFKDMDSDLSATDEKTTQGELSNALNGLRSNRYDSLTSISIGKYLSTHEGEIVGGLVLRRKQDTHRRIAVWRVERVSEVMV